MTGVRPVIAEDEWEDLQPVVNTGIYLPDVVIRLTKLRSGKARARMVFRRGAAALIEAAESPFRVQIGGAEAGAVRIIKDPDGAYKATNMKGAFFIPLGVVNLWPDEKREPAACGWYGDPCKGGLVVLLPDGFAKPSPPAPPAPTTVASPAAARSVAALPPPGAKAVAATFNQRLMKARSDVEPVNLGEPAPGRSALDQKIAANRIGQKR